MEIQETTKTPLMRQICTYEERTYTSFKPSRKFYENIQIGQKRFWKLVRGEESPKISELERLSVFFNVSISELI